MHDAPDTAHRRMRFCEECGGPPHTRTVGHRWRTTCDWPLGCDEQAFRGIEGDNIFGERMLRFYCEPHLSKVMTGETVRETLANAKNMGISTDISRPDVIATIVALRTHQQTCDACRGVRDWIRSEVNAGRVKTIPDRNRVGEYTAAHACPEGLELFAAVGRAMMV